MKIHQIRSATIIVTYNNKRFLIDPWLMPKDYMAGFDAGVNSHIRQPREELPLPIKDIVNTDAVILTHYHPDHWDEFSANSIDKNIPFFVQNEFDKKMIEQFGFKNIRILSDSGTNYEGIQIYRTDCQHGRRDIVKPVCEQAGMPYDASGIVFKGEEKTLYVAGDTIWCEESKTAVDKYKPDVIVINACGATVKNGEKLIMDAEDVKNISEYAKNSVIIASHMDNVSHLTVTRADIKALGLKNTVVPEDNEILEY